MNESLPLGKLPAELLAKLLASAPARAPRLVLGPGVGLDCAVLEFGDTMLVLKSDPVTFASDEIGWYLVQVNANDIATTGATPRWLLSTVLLPEGQATTSMAENINRQVYRACSELGIAVIGGHTEITHGLDRPILMGTLIGEVARDRLVTPRGVRPGDRLLLTKGVPIEATALLAREFPDRLRGGLSKAELQQAREFLYTPGISVLRDAQLALEAGEVTAMHDPTEGGLLSALWELAEAGGVSLQVDLSKVAVPPLAARICRLLELDPLAAIASGALLLTVVPDDASRIAGALRDQGIACREIGWVETGPAAVWHSRSEGRTLVMRPERDEVARAFES
ncbi:MAG: AIR synthase family protein [Trueperaceae bacterium]|nr:MAG: AIR synthase family protein [Trueperaceae bacterium]